MEAKPQTLAATHLFVVVFCVRAFSDRDYQKKLFTLLDLCVSSLRRGHANLLCIVPILTDDPRRESKNYSGGARDRNKALAILLQCNPPLGSTNKMEDCGMGQEISPSGDHLTAGPQIREIQC